uniref:Lamin tail domain containing 2 n=1 Tax=Ailuropoda melanoleuca TaxID=9646 RepID=G1LVJ9_AILME
MAPESCQEAKEAEKEAPLSLVGQEPVNGHLQPPAGTPQEAVAPSCPQDIKPSSTRVVFSVNLQSAPESLDPRTLRLLWRQRDLEIQALRWAIQNHHDARHCHVLHEVAGLPPERSACNQEKVLQNQVQKLTVQLKEQKEQAQLEKSQLEERLLQTMTTMQQLEAELQAFQKSCLLQLARHSWVGRILRSSTGSVEVVTAETLMDFSDLSESEQGPSTGEGFRLEDVDWNSIAQRYPNLFINIESNSDQKSPFPGSPESPPGPAWQDCPDQGVLCRSRAPAFRARLEIVAVNGRERFVRVLNQSLEETADLGGLTLQQRVRDVPVCVYRFPPGTLLAPRHHVTVWGEGPRNPKRQLPSTLGQELVHFHSRRGCVTLLLNPKGEVLSEHQAPPCVSPVSRIFADNTDLSIDRFPLSEAKPAADTCEQRPGPQPSRAGRVREARARRRRPGTRGLFPRLSTGKIFRSREVPAPSEAAETLAPELLPAIPDAGLCLEDCRARTEHRVRVCRKSVDRSCPMVALSVQSTAESKYGFRFLPCPPVTTDRKARV